MQDVAPDGAPRCWARQYQDGDPECKSCGFNWSCKNAFLRAAAAQPVQGGGFSLPVMQAPPNYGYGFAPQQPPQMVQQFQQPPQRTWQPTSATGWQNPVQAQAAQQQGNNQQRIMPYVYADLAQAQMVFQQQFHQYPDESVGQRVGKNIVLRAFEAMFGELTRFFHYWTWPRQ